MSQVFYGISAMQETLKRGEKIIGTMGFFDGVHLGHRTLIQETKNMAHERGAKSMVITLDQHPIGVLCPEYPHPRLLTSLRSKVKLLEKSSLDYILVLPFSSEISQQTSIEFLHPLIDLGLVGTVLGYDNRFGKRNERETLQMFDENLKSMGLEVRRIEKFEIGGTLVSSSAIRACLAAHDLQKLESLLGRPYSFLGIVRHGRQIGRTINYPTANIEPYDSDLAMPPVGIYVAEVRVSDKVYPSMAYYGSSPTITGGDQDYRLEAYLFGYTGDLYHKEVEVAFRAYLRDDMRFDSLAELAAQLRQDEAATLAYYSTHGMTL